MLDFIDNTASLLEKMLNKGMVVDNRIVVSRASLLSDKVDKIGISGLVACTKLKKPPYRFTDIAFKRQDILTFFESKFITYTVRKENFDMAHLLPFLIAKDLKFLKKGDFYFKDICRLFCLEYPSFYDDQVLSATQTQHLIQEMRFLYELLNEVGQDYISQLI